MGIVQDCVRAWTADGELGVEVLDVSDVSNAKGAVLKKWLR